MRKKEINKNKISCSPRLENMKFFFVIACFTITLFLEPRLCQEGICSRGRGVSRCCVDFRDINGSCFLCPEGYHGLECKTPCPDGMYGPACRNFCECEEKQTCDPMRGCVLNFTETTLTSATERHFNATRQNETTPNDLVKGVFLKYLLLTPGGVVFVLVVICLFLSYRKKARVTITGEHGRVPPACGATVEGAIQEVLSQSAVPNLDEMSLRHEYIEIIDVDSTYLEPCNLIDIR